MLEVSGTFNWTSHCLAKKQTKKQKEKNYGSHAKLNTLKQKRYNVTLYLYH